MEPTSPSFLPKRAFIRYKAKVQLQAEQFQTDQATCLDEGLIKDIATTLSQSELYQSRYSHCQSKREAAQIASDMTTDLVNIYKRIQQQQQDPIVQQLNSLL